LRVTARVLSWRRCAAVQQSVLESGPCGDLRVPDVPPHVKPQVVVF
jgi:hypothetical protein